VSAADVEVVQGIVLIPGVTFCTTVTVVDAVSEVDVTDPGSPIS